jgi:hypothetical protein
MEVNAAVTSVGSQLTQKVYTLWSGAPAVAAEVIAVVVDSDSKW